MFCAFERVQRGRIPGLSKGFAVPRRSPGQAHCARVEREIVEKIGLGPKIMDAQVIFSHKIPLEISRSLERHHPGITLVAVIPVQVGNVIGRRSLRGSGLDRGLLANRILLVGVATEILVSWAVVYAPSVHAVLRTGPVAWQIYSIAWLGIPLIFALDSARKRLLGRWEQQRAVLSP
ncbi:MAG: cation-translocating P-type ATPase C-terminal domain-containing protein [Chromatiaceae bacterium]